MSRLTAENLELHNTFINGNVQDGFNDQYNIYFDNDAQSESKYSGKTIVIDIFTIIPVSYVHIPAIDFLPEKLRESISLQKIVENNIVNN